MEEWRPVVGCVGLYEVSNYGRVRSLDRISQYNAYGKRIDRPIRGKVLKPQFDGMGNYLHVSITTKDGKHVSRNVHRLVAEAFVDNPLGLPEVNHKDEDKTNNRANNLEWCDHTYNNNYGSKKDSTKGERNAAAKLTKETVLKIRCDYIPYSHDHGIYELAKKYGISARHVHQIVTRTRWGWLD